MASKKSKIKEVILYVTGEVVTFDQKDEQMDKFTGPVHEMRDKLEAEDLSDVVVFDIAHDAIGRLPMGRENFFSENWTGQEKKK